MGTDHIHHDCPRADQPGDLNPTPGQMRACFITMGDRKHRVGYVCLDCGRFDYVPSVALVWAMQQEKRRRGRS